MLRYALWSGLGFVPSTILRLGSCGYLGGGWVTCSRATGVMEGSGMAPCGVRGSGRRAVSPPPGSSMSVLVTANERRVKPKAAPLEVCSPGHTVVPFVGEGAWV